MSGGKKKTYLRAVNSLRIRMKQKTEIFDENRNEIGLSHVYATVRTENVQRYFITTIGRRAYFSTE